MKNLEPGELTPPDAEGRSFIVPLPNESIVQLQRGTMRGSYRGVPFHKSPLDMGIYLQLFSRKAPASVIEIGSKFGGSALWFADMLQAHGVADPRVITVDIAPQVAYRDPRISVRVGDARALGKVLAPAELAQLRRPWLVVEDSAHTFTAVTAVLDFFDGFLEPGDHIVVEDGILAQLPGENYRRFQNGPNRAVAAFLASNRARYKVDVELCDFYGPNMTYNPNGWLKRI